jgi:hypothetical protein
VRAILVVMLIATPSILLPGTGSDTAQIVSLVAIFAATFTFVEYASDYPGLVEFRDAPPFNRVRFLALFATVFLLTVISRGHYDPTTFTRFVEASGSLIGQTIDFPYSPVRLVVQMLPEGTPRETLDFVRAAAGISYIISLLSLAVFLILLRLQGWPMRGGVFNVWINLPTFDPTVGGDVVARLERDGRYNIALGFLLPFVIPATLSAASSLFNPVSLDSPQTMVWTMAAWTFLPASMFMRGIAMGRIAAMISEKRRQTFEQAERNGLLPA